MKREVYTTAAILLMFGVHVGHYRLAVHLCSTYHRHQLVVVSHYTIARAIEIHDKEYVAIAVSMLRNHSEMRASKD